MSPSNLFPIKANIKETGKEADVAVALHCFCLASAPLETTQQYRKLSNKKSKLALWGQLGRKMNGLI